MEPESEAVRDGLRTLEHQNLPKLIEMLLHIEGLRGRGWLFDEIAAEMTEGPFDPPVGGAWSGPMVAEILGVIDTVREEEDQAAPTPTHTPTSIPAAQPQTPTATPTPTMLSTPSVAPTPTPTQTPTPNPAPVAPAGRTAPLPQLSERRETTTPRGPIIEPRTAAYYQEPRALPELGPETRIPRWPFAALCLLVIGAGVVYLLLNAGSNGDADSAASNVEAEGEEPLAAAAAEDDQQNSIDQTPADEQVGGSAEELAETLSPPEESDPADMMSIRVEPEAPEVIDPATGLPIQPATATVRADGLLHLDGAFPTQADADRYVAGMAEVFGEDNIVENYQINPAAPLPASADVSLDKPVLFASGTAEIDPSYYPFLEACGDVMKLNPQITMSIAAFTDSTGSEELNLELSQQRANAIYQFYLDYDLSQEQLQPLAFGEAEPVADNTTEAGRQENRRAMLRLLDVLATESADDE